MNNYLMPKTNGAHEIVIEKSRFITHVFRVNNVEQANEHIANIRKMHAKANHNCIAYQIGEDNNLQRAMDDGEPVGTAGVPMLDVLKHQDIRNCLVIVTRYFGGIKLGTGGLIRAYGKAVSESLQAIGLVRIVKLQSIWLTCDYNLLDTLLSRIKSLNYQIGEITYGAVVDIEALVEIEHVNSFETYIKDLTHQRVIPRIGNFASREIPI